MEPKLKVFGKGKIYEWSQSSMLSIPTINHREWINNKDTQAVHFSVRYKWNKYI